MKYMTFNSSCAYAGLANMLEQYGVETDARSIAIKMNLPYLFAYENGVYMAGPMLQSAKWFNLFLNPIGFQMIETEVPAEEIPQFLKQQKTAMLGLHVDESGKHAVVYTGTRNEQLSFLNNKYNHDPAPEELLLTKQELTERLESSAFVATLERLAPKEVDYTPLLCSSVSVIRQNLSDIRAVCCREEPVSALRSKLNPLFRPLLLDGITMLDLLGENALAQRFSVIQRSLLLALRSDISSIILLQNFLSIDELNAAAEKYIHLIKNQSSTLF